MQTNTRPNRISLKNTQGKKTTLNSGLNAFSRLDSQHDAKEHIILGLGPMFDNNDLPNLELLDANTQVFFVECADFAQHVKNDGGQKVIPAHWQSITPAELLPLLQGRAIWWYKQNLQFYPSFWADILGFVQAWLLRGESSIIQSKSVIVAGSEQQLLHKELCLAFSSLGFSIHNAQDSLQNLLSKVQPSLFFSVNLRGLDREGLDFALLKSLNIPVALWFVDNPWHILSSLRLPWWKDATLFVTDASFIPELKKHGASKVFHLPLAASQHMWEAQKIAPTAASKHMQATQDAGCIFVGRASFPDNAGFFAAASVAQSTLTQAFNMLEQGEKPHFHWWQEQLNTKLWPEHDVRMAGLGAEECACKQRTLWLQALLTVKPIIFGDSAAWTKLLPTAPAQTFYPALDYYSELGAVYRAATCVLNVTSLLLPAGLTQRHFDVWAAGGFLFTDVTEGLNIFPKNLTQPISITHPSKLKQTIKNLEHTQRQELISAWQEHIASLHSYTKRMSFVLEVLN